jgi:hypothetical protein
MIKIWHQTEKNKVKVSEKAITDKMVDSYDIMDLNPYDKNKDN